uniref:Uncharacterized protein n=1 Tax=Rhizophora mucronata TaxID=61149 RepID=A0A2P2NRN0_RHIMU
MRIFFSSVTLISMWNTFTSNFPVKCTFKG